MKNKTKQQLFEARVHAIAESYPDRRIAWIDRIIRAIDASPGAPPSCHEIWKTAKQLREQLCIFRDGFVDALNRTRTHR